MKQPIKICIVDDHPFFRQGVRLYLETLQDIDLVGEAENGEQALQIVREQTVDVVLMDLEMPGMNGIAATISLLEAKPGIGILILTSFGAEEKILEAIGAGASGYCLKDAPPDELITAIHAVAAGGTYLGRGITPKILTNAGKADRPEADANPADQAKLIFADLTAREQEVLEKLADGLGNKEIAQALFVSEKTVKTHLSNILQKLEVRTRTQAALLFHEYNVKERQNE